MVRESQPGRLKIGLLFPLFLAGVAVLVGRLYNIQIQNHEFLVELARKQSETTVKIPAVRGTICDRNGVPLAFSLKTPAIFADPGIVAVPAKIRRWLPNLLGVPRPTFKKLLMSRRDIRDAVNDPTLERTVHVVKELAKFLRVPENALLVRLRSAVDDRIAEAARKASPVLGLPEAGLRRALSRERRFVWLKRPADKACAREIEGLRIRGICVRYEHRRTTAKGMSIGQWLGIVSAEGRGLEGLELLFDRPLRGSPGLARLRRDGRGKRIADSAEPTIPPRHGCKLHLTIDSRIQPIVDAELENVYSEFSPVSASAVVMEPSTGRILAMGSAPGLDVSTMREMGRDELRRRLRNHVVQSVYEYGSTFKPFVAAAAIDLRLVTPESRIHCENGRWVYRKRRLHDHHPYGVMSITDIIVHSSNIGAAKLGLLLGNERLRQYVLLYHFGKKLGIRLPAEEPGLVTPLPRWTYFTTTSVPIGQEIAGTPLQLVTAFCALVNGGRLMQPYIVECIEDPNTGNMPPRTPLELGRIISPETSAKMRHILGQVVERGTGKVLRGCKYPIGGKTGTAQVADPAGGYSDKYLASFVGFAPVNQPKICVLVMVDQPQGGRYYGGQVAAPAVGHIIEKSLAILDSVSDATAGLPESERPDSPIRLGHTPVVAVSER